MPVAFRITTARWNKDRTQMSFCYELDAANQTYYLEETLELPFSAVTSVEQERLLRALHLALAISYYKIFLPPTITHPYAMSEVEASFWNSVYEHGLAEFIYKNKLSFQQIARFSAQDGHHIDGNSAVEWQEKALLGLGGGKDSVVAGELLKKMNVPLSGFVLATGEQLGQTQAVAEKMEVNLLPVKRTLDAQIFELNKLEGAYNGHIPISLVFGLVGSLVAANNGSRYVVVANEASSSIPHTSWEDKAINHQWSKSLTFERLFQDYLHTYVSKELHYFSAIRPLSSIAVTKLFSRFTNYFDVFTSDNSLFKIRPEERDHPRWSLQSSKSLSSYILFSAWLDESSLQHIFGRNFLNKPALESQFLAMLGVGEEPLLDCVGTPDELRVSLALADQQKKLQSSALMQLAKKRQLLGDPNDLPNYLKLDKAAFPDALSHQLNQTIKEFLT